MRLRILLAAAVATPAMTGTAAAHPQPGGFGMGVSAGWLDPDETKLRDFEQAAVGRPAHRRHPEADEAAVRRLRRGGRIHA